MRAINVIGACLALLLIAATFADAHKPRCKTPPKSNLTDANRRQTASADGVVRTNSGCSLNGHACDLCCDGACCDDVSAVDSSVFTTPRWIGLRFAFVAATNTEYTRATTQGKLADNIRVMNRIFAPLNLAFYVAAATYYSDSRMVAACNTNNCDDPLTCDYYQYLMPRVKGNSAEDLPVVVCDSLPFLGEASAPWSVPENDNQNMVLIDASTVGPDHPGYVGGLGYTLVHEVGHSFGLYHVFGANCAANGDLVADTSDGMTAASESNLCDDVVDTCPANPGNDMLNNYMNYAADECMTEFTAGQKTRMIQSLKKWRPLLMAHSQAPTGTCPTTATSLSDCACGNGQSPTTRCGGASAATATTTAAPGATPSAATTTTASAANPPAAATTAAPAATTTAVAGANPPAATTTAASAANPPAATTTAASAANPPAATTAAPIVANPPAANPNAPAATPSSSGAAPVCNGLLVALVLAVAAALTA